MLLFVTGLSVVVPLAVTFLYVGYTRYVESKYQFPKSKRVALTLSQSSELESDLGMPKSRPRPVLLEVGDYQCPACRQAQQWFEMNEGNLAKVADYGFVNMPLPQHQFAAFAAKIAVAAKASGSFSELHHWLMQATDLRKANIKKHVAGMRSGAGIWANSAGSATEAALELDEKATAILGVGATPSFYVLYPNHIVKQVFQVQDVLNVLRADNNGG
jgi:protein-disulfide isomerase